MTVHFFKILYLSIVGIITILAILGVLGFFFGVRLDVMEQYGSVIVKFSFGILLMFLGLNLYAVAKSPKYDDFL